MNFKSPVVSFLLVAAASIVLITSCDSGTPVDSEETEEKPDTSQTDETFTGITLEPVDADGQLETVTWNLEWYGVRGSGPENELNQTKNILQIVDSLRADLYAFQEVHDQEDLSRITESMKGYRGFVAEFISQSQRTAFVYNTAAIDSISSGAIDEDEGHNRHAWAGGRFPFFFEFNYTYQDHAIPIYAVVIHAKAFDDESSYERRRQAAENMYAYLTENKPDARIIFLGDYNDDVDHSIYEGAETPYQPFVENDQHFRVITKVFSENGVSSTVFYNDMIDHITISNELYGNLVDQSEDVYSEATDFISNYGATTSDHYPVWAKFDLSGQ